MVRCHKADTVLADDGHITREAVMPPAAISITRCRSERMWRQSAIPIYAARTVLLMLFAASAPALARAEDIVLPYTCQMSAGRPSLIPSQPQAHRIAGQREERRVTVCSPADPGRCRAWTAHRFDMLCGGVAVPWAEVVANAPPARGGAAWIENGRFRLAMPPAWALPTQNPCSRLIDDRDPGLARYCANQPMPTQPSYAEMPAGFAPMFGLNGTFTASNAASADGARNPTRPQSLPSTSSPGGNLNWRASPTPPPQPLPPQPDITTADAVPPPASKPKPVTLPPIAARPDSALKPALPGPRDNEATSQSPPLPPAILQPPRSVERPAAVATPPDTVKSAAEPDPKTEPAKPEPLSAEPAKPASAQPALPLPLPLPASPIATAAPPPTVAAPPQSQSAASRTAAEPYSSRPVKLANPEQDLRNSLIMAFSVALVLGLAAVAILWRRGRGRSDTDPDTREPAVLARDYADRSFDPPALTSPRPTTGGFYDGLDDEIRLPGLSASPVRSHPPGDPDHARHKDPVDANDRPMPAFAETIPHAPKPHAPPATSKGRFSTGHTLSMAYDDGVRTHLDADLPVESVPIPDVDPETVFDAPTGSQHRRTPSLTPQPPPVPMTRRSAAPWPTDMLPQTHDDALHILGMGVTSKASLTAMKKIVDGLRLSWHPDHATDDADRAIRELRIRQINTAWDLIAASHTHPSHDPVI